MEENERRGDDTCDEFCPELQKDKNKVINITFHCAGPDYDKKSKLALLLLVFNTNELSQKLG